MIEFFHDTLHLVRFAIGHYPILYLVGEGENSCLILLFENDIGQCQGGINRIIQERKPLKGHIHTASLVYKGIYMLRLLILVLIDHQLCALGGGFPVDCSHIITLYIVTYMLELHGVAYLAYLLDSIVKKALGECNQLKLLHLDKGRISGHHSMLTGDIALYKQP